MESRGAPSLRFHDQQSELHGGIVARCLALFLIPNTIYSPFFERIGPCRWLGGAQSTDQKRASQNQPFPPYSLCYRAHFHNLGVNYHTKFDNDLEKTPEERDVPQQNTYHIWKKFREFHCIFYQAC